MVFGGLRLENYRGFENYLLSDLARVNLLVGKNNCGKTSILEAVQILASQGDPRILANIAVQRGETVTGVGRDRSTYPDISHLFQGHHFRVGIHFRITAGIGSEGVSVRAVESDNLDEAQQFLFKEMARNRRSAVRRSPLVGPEPNFAVLIESSSARKSPTALPVTQNGTLIFDIYDSQIDDFSDRQRESTTPIRSITAESLELSSMREMWNKVLSESREGEVVQSLKILEPDVADIFLLSSSDYDGWGRSKFLVGFEDQKRKRIPLGSFGEGMRRMLALSLSLNQAQGGILLVDEIDTGLHYSILGDMWLLVVNAAIQYDLQVFATTHSLDCIRGLAWLCENHPELAGEVSVQKIDRRLDEAVALDSDEIQLAVDQNLEVR